jgi:potassium-transporting ATPase A subunit
MLLVVLVAVFMAGLMIGRTPEYLGKQLTVPVMKLVGLYVVIGSATLLPLTALAVVTEGGTAGLTTNDGPHGFTEIFFAYASSLANNGQNFAGLSANSAFYNLTTAIAMLVGRFGYAVLALALAGAFAVQGRRPLSAGTLPTDSPIFAAMLVGHDRDRHWIELLRAACHRADCRAFGHGKSELNAGASDQTATGARLGPRFSCPASSSQLERHGSAKVNNQIREKSVRESYRPARWETERWGPDRANTANTDSPWRPRAARGWTEVPPRQAGRLEWTYPTP